MLALAIVAAPATPGAGVGDTAEALLKHESYRLANGMQVILREDHRVPIVAVELWYHVGGRHDPPGRSGLAHLFEHLMFQGSAHAERSFWNFTGPMGAIGVNGSTSQDRTEYYETIPSVNLEHALWLEADRMGFLLNEVGRSALAREKEAAKNERRQKWENQSYGTAVFEFKAALFPAPHPYHGNVIGSDAEIDAVSLDDAETFFDTWYAPSNATLALVGDFDSAKTKTWIEKYFGSLPARPRPTPPAVAPMRLDREVRLNHAEQLGTNARVFVGWHSPALFAPGDAAADVLALILADGRQSRLGNRLAAATPLHARVSADQESHELQSVFEVDMTSLAGATPEALLAEVDAALNELRARAPSDAEVGAAVAKIERRLLARLDGIRGAAHAADQLQFYNHYRGEPNGIRADLARYRAVTAEDVRRFVIDYLVPDRRLVLFAVPKRAETAKKAGGAQ